MSGLWFSNYRILLNNTNLHVKIAYRNKTTSLVIKSAFFFLSNCRSWDICVKADEQVWRCNTSGNGESKLCQMILSSPMSTINFLNKQTPLKSFCYHQQGQLKIDSPRAALSRALYCTTALRSHASLWPRHILLLGLIDAEGQLLYHNSLSWISMYALYIEMSICS